MDSRRFDSLTRLLASTLPRRGVMRSVAAASAAIGVGIGSKSARAAQDADAATDSVGIPCVPCNCTDSGCDCCLIGITGGGVIRTEVGDINLVLFATQLAEDAPQEAAGFVRWMDPNPQGGVSLESVGPIAYQWDEGDENNRNVSGTMILNGQDQHPFVLDVYDAGPGKSGEDTATLRVGAKVGGSGGSGFGYEAAGIMVGGDLQLLTTVAPITTPG